jgi:hypothetical protein
MGEKSTTAATAAPRQEWQRRYEAKYKTKDQITE